MLLYDCTTAPSPRRARMFIAEKGLDIPFQQIDLATGEQLGEAYLDIVPTGTVPALQTDAGDIITENLAIATYLEALHPKPALLGRNPLEKARVLEWDTRITLGAFMACAEIIRNSSPRMVDRALPGPRNYAQIPALAERGRMRLGHFWAVLDDQLSENAFVAGEHYSYADITATACVDFSKWMKASPLETHSHIARWHETMKARPSYTA